ncbi:NAD-dependent epimerase/dehydratase family protein [Bacillota bacterium LX-D]|nr:NAD-dependent epimerase/dehydratase family protein [Bacillota bacterium LX-D]
MRYFITGGAGFIGSHLTLRLLSQGHEVIVLDNFSASPRDRLAKTSAKVAEGDVLDKDLVFTLAESCDYLIHLAAVVGVRLAMAKGREGLKVSCQGTENVLEAATILQKPIFLASSSATYGKILKTPVAEDADCLLGTSSKVSWLYSVAKLVEEHLALAYFRELGTKIKIGRFFNAIGPNQTGAYGMVVPTFINKALHNQPLHVYGTGRQTRTFAYIEDVLDGLEIVLQRGQVGEIYNIGGTEEVSIFYLAQKIKELAQSSSPIQLVPYEEAFDENFEETMQRMPDITKLQKLGYTPNWSLERSLQALINYHRQRTGVFNVVFSK